MAEKICVGCGVANPEHFTYCKYCGAILPVVDRIVYEEPSAEDKKYSFGDISYYEYRRYIGSGADNILYDFELIDRGRKKVFSLPLLFLGLIFGFFGMSAWFFYRNLKKPAFIMLLIALLFTAVDGLLNASLNQMLVGQISSILGGRGDLQTIAESVGGVLSYYSYSVVNFSSFFSFVASFFVSSFALRLYKKHSYSNILRIKETYVDGVSAPLDILLKKAGGTSLGLAFIPVLFAVFFPVICFLGSLLI